MFFKLSTLLQRFSWGFGRCLNGPALVPGFQASPFSKATRGRTDAREDGSNGNRLTREGKAVAACATDGVA